MHRSYLQRGFAILEAAVVLALVLSTLLGGWAAVDIYQRSLLAEELVESRFYDGVVKAYRIDERFMDGNVQINVGALTTFMNERVDLMRTEMVSTQVPEHDFYIQGAVAEIVWPKKGTPAIESFWLSNRAGSLPISSAIQKQLNIEEQARDFVGRMVRDGASRERFIRSSPWSQELATESVVTDRLVLIGVGVALNVRNGLGRMLIDRIQDQPVITRTSFNVLRSDL